MMRVNLPVYEKRQAHPAKKSRSTSLQCSVSRPMALVFAVSGYTGAAPVVISNGQLAYSYKLQVFSCVFVGVLVIVTQLGMVMDINLDYKVAVRAKDSLTTLVWISDVMFMTMTTSLSVITGPKRVRKLILTLRILEEMEKPRQDRWQRRYLWVVFGMMYTATLLLYDHVSVTEQILAENRHWNLCCLYVTFYILYFLVVLMEMQFMMMALAVGDSLRAVNDGLKELLDKLQNINSWTINSASLCELVDRLPPYNPYALQTDNLHSSKISAAEIQRLASCHGRVCDLIQDLDQTNGPFLLLMVIGFLQHLVITPYYLINNIFDDLPLSSLLLQSMWCAFHTINMCAVIEPCHITSNEVKRTYELLSKLFGQVTSTSEPFSQQLELFCRRLILRKVEYSPMGICLLGRPLIAQIIGGVTTYLVIIIQIQAMNY